MSLFTCDNCNHVFFATTSFSGASAATIRCPICNPETSPPPDLSQNNSNTETHSPPSPSQDNNRDTDSTNITCDNCYYVKCFSLTTFEPLHCPICNTVTYPPPLPSSQDDSNSDSNDNDMGLIDITCDNCHHVYSYFDITFDPPICPLCNSVTYPTDQEFDSMDMDQEFDAPAEVYYYEPYPRPAATSFINFMSTRKLPVTESILKQLPSCIICCEEFKLDDLMIKMECSHQFHSHCICRWLCTKNNCPLCRYEFPKEEGDEEVPPYEDNAVVP